MKQSLIVISTLIFALLLAEATHAASGSNFKVRILPMECTINIIDLGAGPIEQITPAECGQVPVVQQLGLFGVNLRGASSSNQLVPTEPGQSQLLPRRIAHVVTILDPPLNQPEVESDATFQHPASIQAASSTPPSDEPHIEIMQTLGTAGAVGVFADVMIFRGRATRYAVQYISKISPKLRK